MPAWKSWFDLRPQFYYSLAGLFVLLFLSVGLYGIGSASESSSPWTKAVIQGVQSQEYSAYMETGWFSARGNASIVLFLATIFLASGGILSESKSEGLLLTLSLPVHRRYWIFAHAGMTAVLILTLSILSTFGVILGSPLLLGKEFCSESPLLGITAGAWLACLPWIGLGILLNSFLHSGMKSILLLFGVHFLAPRTGIFHTLYQWSPWCLADPASWRQSAPWGAVLVSAVIALAGIILAAVRFECED